MSILGKIANRNLSLVFIVAVASSCSSQTNQNSSRTKIDSGTNITSSSPNKIDGVFFTTTASAGTGSKCTGTAVSTNTALTAAHCVYNGSPVDARGRIVGSQYCVSNSIYQNVCSDEIYVNPRFPAHAARADGGHDTAYVVFPEGTFKSYFKVNSNLEVAVGDSIVLVGYSKFHLPDPSQGSKRFGYNTVTTLQRNAQNDIWSRYRSRFEDVGVSPGDSGGPLFKACEVTGVASRMTDNSPNKQNIHTNLTHPNTVAFLKSSQTGYFCGLSGSDERYCPIDKVFVLREDLWGKSKEFPCSVGVPSTSPQDTITPNSHTLFAQLSEENTLRIRGNIPFKFVSVCVGDTAESAKSCSEKLVSVAEGPDYKQPLVLPASGSEYYLFVTGLGTQDGASVTKLLHLNRK